MTDRVAPFLHDLCSMDRLGGRCARLDDSTWELNDVAQWSDAQACRLRARFPALEATIMANRRSLSGFTVVLQRRRAPHAWVSLLAAGVLIAVHAAVVKAAGEYIL